MKKLVKGFLITAVVLILVGMVLCIVGAASGGISIAKDVLLDHDADHVYEFEIDENGFNKI